MSGGRRAWQGGMSDQAAEALEKPFREFRQQATRRVRAARENGFDVAEVERANAADLDALAERVLSSRVQPLRDLIEFLDETAPGAGADQDDLGSSHRDPSTPPC